jgi:hypothetical protein
MKRVGLCAFGIGVLVSFGLLTVEQGLAGENDGPTKCSLATLKGRYLFAGSGTALPPAFGVTEPSLTTSAGYHIFRGDGTGTDTVTFSINGNVVLENFTSPTSYTVNPDCTGTFSVSSRPSFDLFISPDGEELVMIATDPGHVLAEGPQRRVAPK